MCGIFGYVGARRDAATLVLEGLRALEYRGYDSWGIAVQDGARVHVERRVGKIGDATTSLPSSGLALGHTRWATNGGVTLENAHPHVDCSRRIAVVHNGIVANDVELRARLGAAGHRFTSETDTELVAHLVEDALRAEVGPDQLVRATLSAFRLLRGLNAIAVLDVQTGAVAAAKSGTPLVVGLGERAQFLASDAAALLPHSRRVGFVAEGKAVLLTVADARLFDVATGQEERLQTTTPKWRPESAERGAHPDFMTKEIHEQPAVLAGVASAGSTSTLVEELRAATDVFAIGCGSGFHAALAAEYLFAAAGRRVTAVVASELSYRLAFVTPGSLVLALSQSGETIDLLEAARAARARGARIVALTNVEGSSLSRFADVAIPLDVGPERAVVATKSFVAKLAMVFLAARTLGGRAAEAREQLLGASADVRAMLKGERRDALRRVAGALGAQRDLYVLGRGLGHALCLEAALKIKEVSYVHAEGFPAGELKHGVIALIEPGTPVIVLAPDDETFGDVMAAAAQVKARGAVVVGVSPLGHPLFDHHVKVADVGEATSIANAVVAQLVGYDLAVLHGNDPDMPRNLAKSVTVK